MTCNHPGPQTPVSLGIVAYMIILGAGLSQQVGHRSAATTQRGSPADAGEQYSKLSEKQMDCSTRQFDAVVIGAGFAGMYMLKSLRDRLGLKVRGYEQGETVGGTWYWNRYPGARCDSDSYIYCFAWDKQLLQEWEWSERYPEQPEILRYLEHVSKRHDLKRDIQFNTRVTAAEFDETTNLCRCATTRGKM